MEDAKLKKFVALAREIVRTGKPQGLTVRQLLDHFGQERRGREVIRYINYKLRYLGVETEPRFDQVHIDSMINIIKRPKRSRGRPRKEEQPALTTHEANKPTLASQSQTSDEIGGESDDSPRSFLTVGLLSSDDRELHTVRGNEPIERAVTLMMMHHISHVPVIQSERNVEGMITWRSIGQSRAANRSIVKASDCMEPVRVLPFDASLFEAVRDVIRYGAVVIQSKDKKISGLVTAKDIARQFVELSEPFLFIEQIENHLRRLLKKPKLTTRELQELVDPADENRKKSATTVDDLTFGEYYRAFSQPSIWGRIKLGIDRELFIDRLRKIQEIRNRLMHFHPDPMTEVDKEALSKTREMLHGL